jgi:hypothetical protein
VESAEQFGGLRPALEPGDAGIHPGNVVELVPAVLVRAGRDRCKLLARGRLRCGPPAS